MTRRQQQRAPGGLPGADPPHPEGGLERGRRRDQHRRAILQAGACDRDLAAVVGDAVLLLEARVVLLVDHDQAERRQRQEDRRAGADHDALAAFGDAPPGAPPRRRAELGMPQRRRPAEAHGETLEQLRGQRDLGQEDQRLAAGREHRCDRLEVDLGLAGARQPLEQGDAVAPADRRAEHARRVGLGRGQLSRPEVGNERRLLRLGQRRRRQEPGLGHRLDDARADARRARERCRAARQAVRQRCQDLAPRRGQARGLAGVRRREQTLLRRRRLERGRHAQHELQDIAERRHRGRRDVVDQAAERGRQRGGAETTADRLELRRGRRRGGARVPHHPDHLARPERHLDDVARRQLQRRGQGVVERRVERQRHQHRHGRGGAGRAVVHFALRERERSLHCRDRHAHRRSR